MTDRAWMGLTLVSDEEAGRAEFVVCARARDHISLFNDDVQGACHDCGESVVFRPHAPKRPPRICVQCMLDRFQGGRA